MCIYDYFNYGYNSGARILNSGFDEGTGPIHFTKFECEDTSGTEERLLDCMHDVDDGEDHNSDAGVMCMSGESYNIHAP